MSTKNNATKLPPKPDWWPKNPYPEDIFPMTSTEYAKAIKDERLRTAISGCLGRVFWNLASEQIWEKWCERNE